MSIFYSIIVYIKLYNGYTTEQNTRTYILCSCYIKIENRIIFFFVCYKMSFVKRLRFDWNVLINIVNADDDMSVLKG